MQELRSWIVTDVTMTSAAILVPYGGVEDLVIPELVRLLRIHGFLTPEATLFAQQELNRFAASKHKGINCTIFPGVILK